MATPFLRDLSASDAEIEDLDVQGLLELRARIDAALPDASLKSVNIERELVLQLQVAKELQKATLEDETVAANQKAQCLNAASGALASLARLQNEVYTSERLKTIESVLIECIQDLSVDIQEAFFAEYERVLGERLS